MKLDDTDILTGRFKKLPDRRLVTKGGGPEHKDGTFGEGSGGAREGAGRPREKYPAIGATYTDKVEEHMRADVSDYFGNVSDDQWKYENTKMDATIKKFVPMTDIVVRRHYGSLRTVLENGAMRNQHSVKPTDRYRGSGSFDIPYRLNAEEDGLGVRADTPTEERPIYGYLRGSDKQGWMPQTAYKPKRRADSYAANMYGEVKFILKPEIRKRTYITFGDSLGPMHMHKVLPMLIDQADWHSVVPNFRNYIAGAKNLEDITNIGDGLGYTEAQILGGIKLEDIDRIEIDRDSTDSKPSWRKAMTQYIKGYNQNGIKVVDQYGDDW